MHLVCMENKYTKKDVPALKQDLEFAREYDTQETQKEIKKLLKEIEKKANKGDTFGLR